MKEFIAGLVLTLVIGGIGIAIEMQEREEVKYINADCNWNVSGRGCLRRRTAGTGQEE